MRSLLSLCTILMLTLSSSASADDERLTPSTDLTPQEVVNIVVEALRTNDSPGGDDGIATVFEFASPSNRSHTGPLERFTYMIKQGFSDMLNHRDSRYDEMDVQDEVAVQAVWLTTSSGDEVGYAFQLGKQTTGDYAGMWMTESVIPLGRRASSGQSI